VLLGVLVCLVAAGAPVEQRIPKALVEVLASAPDEAESALRDIRVRPVASFDLPGPPLGLVFSGDDEGYIAVGTGEIAHFDLSDELQLNTVVDGLSQPRGVAFHDGRLYVTDVSVPCGEVGGLTRCSERDFPDTWPGPAQAQILLESRGRILAYDAQPDGALTDERVILDDLPAATSDHAVNDILIGNDEQLYVAIGNVDSLRAHPELLDEVDRPNLDLLGTVTRVDPDDGERSVIVRGLRNVYGLAVDGKGQLYGVDNDGPTVGGYRAEEVLRFRRGEHYGYPSEGTYGPFSVRTAGPLWTLRTNGSAGLAWAPDVGLPDGLIIGSCSQLMYVRIREDSGRPFFRNDEQRLLEPRGCIPVVEAAPDGRLIIATINPNKLLVYDASVVD
jgi:glucose/arabinose dehydrogenase